MMSSVVQVLEKPKTSTEIAIERAGTRRLSEVCVEDFVDFSLSEQVNLILNEARSGIRYLVYVAGNDLQDVSDTGVNQLFEDYTKGLRMLGIDVGVGEATDNPFGRKKQIIPVDYRKSKLWIYKK